MGQNHQTAVPPQTDWQEMETAPKDGTVILLYFPGEGAEVRMGAWSERQLIESGNVVREEIGWRMQDRAEVRAENDPAMWCPISEPPPPPAPAPVE